MFIPKIYSRYEDAFDLMICSDISLNVGIDCDTVYTAIAPKFRNYDIQVLSNDPCRAIAECFLLMKDAESNNG